MLKNIVFIILAAFMLASCTPIYMPEDFNNTVILKSLKEANLSMCSNNKIYSLRRFGDGNFHIPHGKRITLYYHYSKSTGNGVEQCGPLISFIPIRGHMYYLNFDIKDRYCSIEMLRYSNQNKTGLVPESSVRRTASC